MSNGYASQQPMPQWLQQGGGGGSQAEIPKKPKLTSMMGFMIVLGLLAVLQIVRLGMGLGLKDEDFGNMHTRSDQFIGHLITFAVPILLLVARPGSFGRIAGIVLALVLFLVVIFVSNYYPASFPGESSEADVKARVSSIRTWRIIETGIHVVILLIAFVAYRKNQKDAEPVVKNA